MNVVFRHNSPLDRRVWILIKAYKKRILIEENTRNITISKSCQETTIYIHFVEFSSLKCSTSNSPFNINQTNYIKACPIIDNKEYTQTRVIFHILVKVNILTSQTPLFSTSQSPILMGNTPVVSMNMKLIIDLWLSDWLREIYYPNNLRYFSATT